MSILGLQFHSRLKWVNFLPASSADNFCKQFGPKLFKTMVVFLRDYFEKVDSEKKNRQPKHENLPIMQVSNRRIKYFFVILREVFCYVNHLNCLIQKILKTFLLRNQNIFDLDTTLILGHTCTPLRRIQLQKFGTELQTYCKQLRLNYQIYRRIQASTEHIQ